MVVKKPPGWLAQPDGGSRPDILAWAAAQRNKPGKAFVGLVHRLDLAVGGLMALAKTSKGAERLSRQFRERTVTKIYWALTAARPAGRPGPLENTLIRAGDLTRPARPDEKGTRALLCWKILSANDRFSLLEIDLKTGFKHQIRAQLAAAGAPIVGDVRYGGLSGGPDRTAIGLWARALSFDQPVTRERQTFVSDPPPDLWPFSLAAGLMGAVS